MLDPSGRVVMLSGATGGIGSALVRRLYQDGFQLSLGVRDPAKAQRTTAGRDAKRVLVAQFDAAVEDNAADWVNATVGRFGRIDALINNAGILRQITFDHGDETGLDELWAVNVKAPFRLIRHALPHLAQAGSGRIINMASTDGKRVREGTSIGYAMSKHAVMALSHAAKLAGWPLGIRVTALCPGAVDTPMIADLAGATPVAERLSPATLAEIVAFLLRLPNTASVPELVVNTRLEWTL